MNLKAVIYEREAYDSKYHAFGTPRTVLNYNLSSRSAIFLYQLVIDVG